MSVRTKRQIIAVLLFLVVVVFFTTTFRMAVVRGDSMLPTYRDGEVVLVNRLHAVNGPLRQGDVILIQKGDEVLIKRIAYLPGQTIDPPASRAFRRVLEYFEMERLPDGPGFRNEVRVRLKVPPKYVVVLGDNPAVSEDSRLFGPIPLDDVLGRVVGSPPKP
jgi:signal peptidase I